MTPIAVSLGDPAGIGPEITGKAWIERAQHGLGPFFAVGDAGSISAVWDGPVERISSPDEVETVFARALPLLAVESGEEVNPGFPTPEGARCALDSLEMAVGLARSGAARAVVTGPVSKNRLYLMTQRMPAATQRNPVPQIIENQLFTGAVNDIPGISLPALIIRHAMHNKACT